VTTHPQQGTLLLADLSGFTAYLAQTELEHAHDILSELLQLIVDHFRPTLTLAEVEGDAVFAHAPEGTLPRGEMLLDLVERTYGAFLGRVEAIRLHTTCSCSACRSIPTLDLKFIIHHGPYVLQAIVGPGKPLGSDVNLAHRLLKNHIGETTGWKAYLLLTEAAARALSIPTDGMHWQIEAYAEFPGVTTFSYDLRQRWIELRRHQAVRLGDAETDLELTVDLDAPPAIVWDWFNDPKRRAQWIGLAFDRVSPTAERTGVGTVAHCTHGQKTESVHTILDWQPFDYFTEEIARPSDGEPQALNTIILEATDRGTRVRSRHRVLVRPRLIAVPFFKRKSADDLQFALATLQRLVAQGAPAPTSSATVADG